MPIPRLLLRARGLGIARGVVPVLRDCRSCCVGGDDMMDDYSRIVALESELSSLRNELTTAYMVGYRDGSSLHHYIPAEVTQEILRVWDHGDIKHPGEEWKKLSPHVHMLAAEGHINHLSIEGRDREHESGCYHLAHAIVRYMMALAQYMGAVSTNGESAGNNE